MRQVWRWFLAVVAGMIAGDIAWLAMESFGHEPQLAAGVGVGAGVAIAAVVARAIEKQHQARERHARFLENNQD